MKKINKKTVTPKRISKVLLLHLVFASLFLIALAFITYRYGIVATVNGRPVFFPSYYKELQKQAGSAALSQTVNESLVYGEAAKKGVKIDQSLIDAEVAKIETQVKSQGQNLEDALATEGMTKADLEKEILLQLTVEKLANPTINITQKDIDKFLVDYKDQLSKTATKAELQELAKTQLTTQLKNEAISTWFSELKKAAKISYH